jgi:nitrogen regulatory protein PII-like uncharacterized protein
MFDIERPLTDEVFRPTRVPHEVLPPTAWNSHRIAVDKVEIEILNEFSEIRVMICGVLGQQIVRDLVEDLRANLQRATSQPCRILEFDRPA